MHPLNRLSEVKCFYLLLPSLIKHIFYRIALAKSPISTRAAICIFYFLFICGKENQNDDMLRGDAVGPRGRHGDDGRPGDRGAGGEW